MDSDISEEELDTFLKEAGILTKREEISHQIENEESLEKLLEEIIGSVQTTPSPVPSLSEDKISPILFEKEKSKRSKFPLLPLFLSIVFLGGVFLGTIFGFYWGKTQRVDSPAISFEELDAKITGLLNQIQEIYDKITPITPPGEVIEPLEPPQGVEQLAPQALL